MKNNLKLAAASALAVAALVATVPAFAYDGRPSAHDNDSSMSGGGVVTMRHIADEVNDYLAQHQSDIEAEAAQTSAVVSAKAALDSYGSGHDYQKYLDAYNEALAQAKTDVTNKYTKQLQESWKNAMMQEGRYTTSYDTWSVKPKDSATDDNGENEPADNQDNTADNKDNTVDNKDNVADNKDGVATDKATSSKVSKAAAAQTTAKALPKTSAVK